MLSFGWSPFFPWSPFTPVSFPNPWWPFKDHQLGLQCSTDFQLWKDPVYYLSFRFPLFPLLCGSLEHQNLQVFFLLIDTWSDLLGGIWYPFIFQSPREFYGFDFLGLWILVCAYIIWQDGQILISCTISTWSPFPSSHTVIYIYICIYNGYVPFFINTLNTIVKWVIKLTQSSSLAVGTFFTLLVSIVFC